MRDPKRIKRITDTLYEYWICKPDLRFGQVMELMKKELGTDDLFYLEDDVILDVLTVMAGRAWEDKIRSASVYLSPNRGCKKR